MMSDKPAVLFVDDEPAVLSGLRARMRRLRREYDFEFAGGAEEAIEVLERRPVAVVVTDMRMPDRTGADLLEEVRFRFPEVIRYVLSGQPDDRLIHRSVAVTHRWLSKPCDHDVMVAALAEAVGDDGAVHEPEVRRALGSIDALPSHPLVHRRLVEVSEGERPTIAEVARLIASDPAATAKLLQWASSIEPDAELAVDLDRAVEVVGLDALAHLVVANDVVRPTRPTDMIPGFGPDLFHRHSQLVAHVASKLSEPSEAGLARHGGLLATIGLLIEASRLPERLAEAYVEAEQAEGGPVRLVEMEHKLWGSTHPEVGSHLLGLWGLPPTLVTLVRGSTTRPDPTIEPPFSAAQAVRAARLVVQRGPLARVIGLPHLDPIDDEPELVEAVDRWCQVVDLGRCDDEN